MKGTCVGDYRIVDTNDDKVIDNKDKKSFGSPSPKTILGFSNTFKYGPFSLSFDLYSELGKKKYNSSLVSINKGEGFYNVTYDYFNNRWDPNDNPNGTLCAPNEGNYSNQRKQSQDSNPLTQGVEDFTYPMSRT